ncbi:MAG: hypothetical protein ABSC05_36500 [Candidatus Solibacter sp.]|jgi:hypothetical protein
MPMRKTWLLRLPEILEELTGLQTPVIDRAVFERIFGVRRRRAVQLMHYFDGYQSGRVLLVERLALIAQLEPLQAGAEFVLEQRRRQRLSDHLDQVRRYRAAARVSIPVKPGVADRRLADLPDGIQLQPGSLRVEFGKAEDLLAKLFELSKAAAHDFEAFRGVAEGH